MDKTMARVLGAVGALAAAGTAQAATAVHVTQDAPLQATSYADLLKPIPNAMAVLKDQRRADANKAADAEPEATLQDAQLVVIQPHHHHHHHRYYRRRHYHHHHHHHHHHAYFPHHHHHHNND